MTFENINLDEDLMEDSENISKEFNGIFKYVNLSNWADAKINNNPLSENHNLP